MWMQLKTHAFGNESTIYLRGLGEAEIGTIQKGKVDTLNTKGEQTIYFFEDRGVIMLFVNI
jgi:hypothetical protein